MVSSILWYQSARRAAFTIAFPSLLRTARESPRVAHRHPALREACPQGPRYFGVRLRTFPFYGRRTAYEGVERTGREKSNRRTTGSLECQPFGAGARLSLAAKFTSSERELHFIF